MAETYKVLGQAAPAATTEVDLYTVPASKEAVVSTITVVNRGTSAGEYRLVVAPAGAATANQHYVAYNITLGGEGKDEHTQGITLAATDVIRVYASSADFSFSAFGTEIT